jgi:subtilisin family serine protease
MLTGLAGDSLAQNPNGNAPFRDGFVLLRFADNVPAGVQIAILTAAGATAIRTLGVGALLVKVQPGRVLAAIQVLKAHHEIIYAEPDFLWTLEGATLPNDTYIGIQWAAQNTGQPVNHFSGAPGADQRTAAAWGISTGANSVVVATLDSGIQYSHPDLLTNIWNNPGGINGCTAGTHGYNVLTATCDPMDDDTKFGGHGTHVGGILGAVGNDAAGVAGVNWTTSIMAVKWVPSDGSQGATSDLVTALDWVVKAKQAGVNVRVVNDSADGGAFSQALSDEIDLLGQNNILFVTAAGNEQQDTDTTPRYPCSYNRPTMICVAATNQIDNLASFSNFGATAVQLGAPGVNIFSTLRSSNYGYIDGTSMAAPQVAGTAALILSLGDQTVSNLRSMILNNVDPLPSLSGLVTTGGRLNVCRALPGCENAVTALPGVLAAPVTTGTIQYGAIDGASTGGWSGVPTNFTYQWHRCDSNGSNCSSITGATSQSYAVLASADQGATLAVAVTASNASGSSTARSTPSAVVASQSSPFAITSTISDGATLKGSVQ